MSAMIDLLSDRASLQSAIAARRRQVLKPPPAITASEWADTYRIVPSETSAVTGRWDTSMYEVARGPMDAITEPGVRIITGVASAQIFKTSTGETAIGYFMHLAPRPILVYEPTDTTVDAFVDSKLDPMIKSSPVLAALWGGRAALERKNDRFIHAKKTFAGGYVEILTANSPANTASRSAGVVFMDEVDKFEMTRDGDPVALIDERLKGFTGDDLSIRMSTPTIEGESPIMAEYLKSDRRKPYVKCPHCGEYHYFKWSQVFYKDADGKADPDRAAYHCESCGSAWTEAERIKALTTKGSISWRQPRRNTPGHRRAPRRAGASRPPAFPPAPQAHCDAGALMLIAAIDPGLKGALALVDLDDMSVVGLDDMPVETFVDGRQVPDGRAVHDLLRSWNPDLVVLEHVEPRGTDGRASMWRFAAGFGSVMTAAQLYSGAERRLTLVRPAIWKPALGLSADKRESLTMAREIFPDAANMLARAKDTVKSRAGDGADDTFLDIRNGRARNMTTCVPGCFCQRDRWALI